ncbi:alpha/beta fold hydrolase, partial [Spirillospora sp. NPDC049652]
MAYVRARGIRFHVVDLGRDTGRSPVVMLHGLFTGSAASWFFTAAPALARTRRVRLPDWRGHGLTERTPTGYDTATMADDLAALTADLPPFAIAGHSYGATVAVRFARAHPGRTTALALVDPPFVEPDFSGHSVPEAVQRSVTDLLTLTSLPSDLAADPPVTAAELAELAGLPVLAVVGSGSPFRAAADLVGQALPAARRH